MRAIWSNHAHSHTHTHLSNSLQTWIVQNWIWAINLCRLRSKTIFERRQKVKCFRLTSLAHDVISLCVHKFLILMLGKTLSKHWHFFLRHSVCGTIKFLFYFDLIAFSLSICHSRAFTWFVLCMGNNSNDATASISFVGSKEESIIIYGWYKSNLEDWCIGICLPMCERDVYHKYSYYCCSLSVVYKIWCHICGVVVLLNSSSSLNWNEALYA